MRHWCKWPERVDGKVHRDWGSGQYLTKQFPLFCRHCRALFEVWSVAVENGRFEVQTRLQGKVNFSRARLALNYLLS